jgi:hypothetical protein
VYRRRWAWAKAARLPAVRPAAWFSDLSITNHRRVPRPAMRPGSVPTSFSRWTIILLYLVGTPHRVQGLIARQGPYFICASSPNLIRHRGLISGSNLPAWVIKSGESSHTSSCAAASSPTHLISKSISPAWEIRMRKLVILANAAGVIRGPKPFLLNVPHAQI